MGRMHTFLRGLDAWLERADELDVCADVAAETEMSGDGDETEESEGDETPPEPASIAH